jgi:hypothetical protein
MAVERTQFPKTNGPGTRDRETRLQPHCIITPQLAFEDYKTNHPLEIPYLRELESIDQLQHGIKTMAFYQTMVMELSLANILTPHQTAQLLVRSQADVIHDQGKMGIICDDVPESAQTVMYEKYPVNPGPHAARNGNHQTDIRPLSKIALTDSHSVVGSVMEIHSAELGLKTGSEAYTRAKAVGKHHNIRIPPEVNNIKTSSYPLNESEPPMDDIEAWDDLLLKIADTACAMKEFRQDRPPLDDEIVEKQLAAFITLLGVEDTFRKGPEDDKYVRLEYVFERKAELIKTAMLTTAGLEKFISADLRFFADVKRMEVAELSKKEAKKSLPILSELIRRSWESHAEEIQALQNKLYQNQFRIHTFREEKGNGNEQGENVIYEVRG